METATADTSPSTTKGSKGYGGEDPGCRGGYAYGCAPPVKAIVVNEEKYDGFGWPYRMAGTGYHVRHARFDGERSPRCRWKVSQGEDDRLP
eukprot:4762181-Pyramimonas_sp.AAC.1